MIRQASMADWNERAYEFWLCQLPMVPEEIHARWGIEFEDYFEDGLGPHQGAVIFAGDMTCVLSAATEGPMAVRAVMVRVQSHEPDTSASLAAVVSAFGIDRASLLWESELIGPARWAVIRMDADDQEKEIGRYQMDASAMAVARNLERDFGQRCIVRLVE